MIKMLMCQKLIKMYLKFIRNNVNKFIEENIATMIKEN